MNTSLEWMNVIILVLNGLVIYFAFLRTKNQDFEKHLFDKKLDAYEKINFECSQILKKIDLESNPFDKIYDYKSKEAWQNDFQKNIEKMVGIGITYLEDVQAEYGLIISNNVFTILSDYLTIVTRFVVEAHHFDTGLLIDKQERAEMLLEKLRQEMRKDLNLEEIDSGLKNRLKEKLK